MATIPDPNQIQRRPGSTGTSVVRAAGNPMPEAMDRLSGDLKAQMDVRNKQEVARATNKFLLVKAEQDNKFDDDPEYETIPSRYKSNVDEGLSLAAQEITDPQIRLAFQDEMSVRVAEGEQRMVDLQRQKYAQKEAGDIANEAAQYVQNSVAPNADINASIQAMDFRFDTAAETGVLPYDAAQKAKIAFRNEIAVNRLNGLSPSDRLAVFEDNPTWLANIDANTQARLKREAEEAQQQMAAQELSMEMLGRDLSPAQADQEIAKRLGYGPQFDAASREYRTRWGAREQTRVEEGRQAFTELWEAVNPSGGRGVPLTRIRSEYAELWEKLTVAQREALMQAEADAAMGKVVTTSDPAVLMNLNILNQQRKNGVEGAAFKLYEYVTASMPRLNASDQRTWAALGATGLVGEEVKPLFNMHDQIEMRVPEADRPSVMSYLDQLYFDFVDQEQRMPNAKERSDMVSQSIEEHVTRKRSFWFDATKPVHEMAPDEVVEAMLNKDNMDERVQLLDAFEGRTRQEIHRKYLERLRPDVYRRTMELLTQGGGQPTHEQVTALYASILRQEGGDGLAQ